jgi:hypothetical protein
VQLSDTDSREAVVRIIEWRTGKHRAVDFGPDEGHFTYEESGNGIDGPGHYSAYVTWPDLGQEELGVLSLRDMAPGDVDQPWQTPPRSRSPQPGFPAAEPRHTSPASRRRAKDQML